MGNRNSGPRPKSYAANVLRGVTRADRLNRREPVPPAGPVDQPGTLSPGAARVWTAWAPVCLAMRTLSPADALAFATLCELQASFTTNARRKGRPTFDPGQERALAAALRPFYALFGLDPASRSRLTTTPAAAAPVSKWAV